MHRLFRYLIPFSGRLWFSVLSGIANKIADLMPPLLVGWVIDSVSGKPPQWILAILGDVSAWKMAVFLSVLAVVIFATESAFQWMYQYGFMTLAQKLQHHLRLDTYQQVQKREIAFFENHRMGNTLSILNDDINQLERFLYNGFVELIHLAVLVLFSAYVMLTVSWQLAVVGLLPVPLVIWGSLAYQRWVTPYYKSVRNAAGELASRLENNLSGILVLKSFTAEAFETKRVKQASEKYMNRNHNVIVRNAVYVPAIRMLVALGFGGVLLMGSYWILNGATFITIGQLVLFSMLTQRVLWPLTRLGNTLDDYARASASAQRVFDLLDTQSAIQDPPHPVELSAISGHLDIQDVRFAYRRDIPVLNGLRFSVATGETLGIAGTTGSGKSTLIKLLLRLYDPTDGAIRIDETDIRTLSLKTLRRSIALVSQDVYLFHGSILENIAYGLDEVSRDAVIAAAKSAELHEFVQRLPEGYDTIVGERGIKLSGGQRQRLSIARAILKNAPIMVFDEATSSVDTETERAIQRNIFKLTQGKTALIIAHRLSTIRHAHRIIVINDGIVAESGTHEELVSLKGHYAGLWQVQVGEEVL